MTDNGNKTGPKIISRGVKPDLPVGPGNPPASGMFNGQPGPGRPKGARNAKTIMRDMLKVAQVVDPNDTELRKKLAKFLGKEPDQVTNRELGLLGQVNKMIAKADTQAATFCFKVSGELKDDVMVTDMTRLRLDDVTAEEVEHHRKAFLDAL